MANVTSKHSGPLGLPGGPVIPAGGTVLVEKWGIIKEHQVVKAWLDAGVIFAEEDEKAVDPETDSGAAGDGDNQGKGKDAEEDEKDRLIADLAQFGIEKDRRSSVETLQEALDAALASENSSQGE